MDRPVTCADAIARVIASTARPMHAAEIASEINRRELYKRGDARQLEGYQVNSTAHANPGRFQITAGLITTRGDHPHPPDDPAAHAIRADTSVCVLIGCVSRKESTARAAKDLYRGALFARRRQHAEATGQPWLIFSALHGIVDPDQVIEPYDLRITDLGRSEREVLADRVGQALAQRFGALSGMTFEVHAGEEYVQVIKAALAPFGALLARPLRGLGIGEQLAWYGQRPDESPEHLPAPKVVGTPDTEELTVRHPGLAKRITAAFQAGDLDLNLRPDAPAPGWAGMPEIAVAERMRSAGASHVEVRRLLTFTAAMDRARDADALWFAAGRLFAAEPWAFMPEQVVARSLTELADALREYGVSQRHGPDAAAWRVIAESLSDPDVAPPVHRAVIDGRGDARELLEATQSRSPGGTGRFPFLRGPKVGPMWVRMLVQPGGGQLSSLEHLPVAVDLQIRKITEYLGVTDTAGLALDMARPTIQEAWSRDVADNGADGPGQLKGTSAALDPALWFWAKWGCTRCERSDEQKPISAICEQCRFPSRTTRTASSPGRYGDVDRGL